MELHGDKSRDPVKMYFKIINGYLLTKPKLDLDKRPCIISLIFIKNSVIDTC